MEEEKPLKIDITEEKKEFQSHLDLYGNERVIFSGKFGIGKTYFLKDFFEKNENYKAIHLFPVNYSVASNEDIFELIKVDILYKLLEDPNIEYEKLDFELLKSTPYLLNEGIEKLSIPSLALIPKIGKPLSKIAENLIAIANSYEGTKEFDQEKRALEVLKEITKQKGSIYEFDSNTELIINMLIKYKGDSEDGKESVLIIDDLDRVDPEHIFRLFNVFAAHFDLDQNTPNKFGFDKVIFVCDIDNIRKIFHGRYGQDIDFGGYIDKFYSRVIYYFNNSWIVNSSINKIRYSFTFKDMNGKTWYLESIHEFYEEMEFILSGLVTANAINLRSLFKLHHISNNIKKEFLFINNNITNGVPVHNFSFGNVILIFKLLCELFGDMKNVLIALEKCTELKDSYSNEDIHDKYNIKKSLPLILILELKNHKLELDKEFKYNEPDLGVNIKYKIKVRESRYYLQVIEDFTSAFKAGISYKNYFNILNEAGKEIDRLKLLK